LPFVATFFSAFFFCSIRIGACMILPEAGGSTEVKLGSGSRMLFDCCMADLGSMLGVLGLKIMLVLGLKLMTSLLSSCCKIIFLNLGGKLAASEAACC